ncbi:MAG: hypothetical protein RR263_00430 [Oscillospiraceae bacterium]
MNDFKIISDKEKISSINKTIRIRPEVFDKITELSEKHDISFNRVVNQCLDYALKNLSE